MTVTLSYHFRFIELRF